MTKRKPHPKVHNEPAITITRTAYAESELVYIAYADKPLRYKKGDSRIAYIGTTKNGVGRVASSAAWKARDVLFRRGISKLDFYIVSAPRYRGHATYRKLERALLIRFSERYGEIPTENIYGGLLRWRDELKVFTLSRINKILDDFA